MAILRIMNVGANCVRPQTTMFIDNLTAAVLFCGGFSWCYFFECKMKSAFCRNRNADIFIMYDELFLMKQKELR